MSLHDPFALAFKVAERRAAYTQKTADMIACVSFSGLTGTNCRPKQCRRGGDRCQRKDTRPVQPARLRIDIQALRARYRDERDKRLRSEGKAQYVEVDGRASPTISTIPTSMPDFAREPVSDETEVVIVGGGFGGLLCGARLRAGRHRLISASWKRRPISAAPGTGTATPARPATPRATSICRCSKRSATCRATNTPGRRRSTNTRRASAEHFDLYDDALFQTEVTELRWDEDDGALDRRDRPRRRASARGSCHGRTVR